MIVECRASVVLMSLAMCVTSCSATDDLSAGTDSFVKAPNSCGLLAPEVVQRFVGSSVAGKYIDGSGTSVIQECSWSTLANADHPDETFGQLTVFVDTQKSGPMGSGAQQVANVYKKELGESGCAPLANVAVDKSCVFPGRDIRLVAFRKSNLFVRITCSVRNPNACAESRRDTAAGILAKAVLGKL